MRPCWPVPCEELELISLLSPRGSWSWCSLELTLVKLIQHGRHQLPHTAQKLFRGGRHIGGHWKEVSCLAKNVSSSSTSPV